jgi:hypothetical protein
VNAVAAPAIRDDARAPLSGVTVVKLSPYGATARIVRIDDAVASVECTVRLKVGAPVQATFEGHDGSRTVPGRVMRTEVASMGRDGLIRYHVSLAFEHALPIADWSAPATAGADPRVTAMAGATAPAAVTVQTVRNRW